MMLSLSKKIGGCMSIKTMVLIMAMAMAAMLPEVLANMVVANR